MDPRLYLLQARRFTITYPTSYCHARLTNDQSQATPPNIAGAANGHSYTFGFNNFHGAQIPQPGLAKFLFECEFGLFDKVPASGQGVWTPSPAGKYACNGNVPNLSTTLRIALAANPIGWKMAYHDLAFLIKVLHDTQGVEKESPFFDFAFNYTPDVGRVPYARVANGEFVRSFGNGGVTTS